MSWLWCGIGAMLAALAAAAALLVQAKRHTAALAHTSQDALVWFRSMLVIQGSMFRQLESGAHDGVLQTLSAAGLVASSHAQDSTPEVAQVWAQQEATLRAVDRELRDVLAGMRVPRTIGELADRLAPWTEPRLGVPLRVGVPSEHWYLVHAQARMAVMECIRDALFTATSLGAASDACVISESSPVGVTFVMRVWAPHNGARNAVGARVVTQWRGVVWNGGMEGSSANTELIVQRRSHDSLGNLRMELVA